MGSFKLSLELQDPNKREPTMLCVDDDVSMDGVLALRTKEYGDQRGSQAFLSRAQAVAFARGILAWSENS